VPFVAAAIVAVLAVLLVEFATIPVVYRRP
jgi:hypothetical protein